MLVATSAHRVLTIATADPTDMQMEQDVGFASGRTVKCEVASPNALHDMIEASYSPEQTIEAAQVVGIQNLMGNPKRERFALVS